MIGLIISIIVLIGIDQGIKIIMQLNQIGVIEKIRLLFIEIEYKEEILSVFGKQLNFVSIIFSILLIMLFIILFFNRYAKNVRTRFNFIPFLLIISGLISNLINKIINGFSIKYISIPSIFKNTCFSLADIYIYIGLILLIVFYLIKIIDSYTLGTVKEKKEEKK